MSIFVCLSVHTDLYKHSCLWSLEEDIGPLGSGMAGACEPPDVVAGD